MTLDALAMAQGVLLLPLSEEGASGRQSKGKSFLGPDWAAESLAYTGGLEPDVRALWSARLIGIQSDRLSLDRLERILTCPWFPELLWEQSVFCHFQPIVSFSDQQVIGFEAVARAEIASRLVSGGELIEAAKAFGVLRQFDRQAVQAAIREGSSCLQEDQRLYVNVQPSSLAGAGSVLEAARDVIRETGIDPGRIVFEMVESEPLPAVSVLAKIRLEINEMGALFALDDVGSGYGALTNIVALQPDFVKIDGSLVRQQEAAGCLDLVSGLVKLAKGTGAKVVIEGIETDSQWRFGARAGADYGQGYLLGRPQALTRSLRADGQALGTSLARAA
ncbi:MAG: EAL domain-containing protein [Fimbriimonadaceae bacterium]|nr:EAL domain-containing protein [Fimbriimonadaceae bacterium]QYK57721.1 MAG: EAL domain-containing protein [Fimbriimonadaceae bacterium]